MDELKRLAEKRDKARFELKKQLLALGANIRYIYALKGVTR